MALIRSVLTANDDTFQEELKYYLDRIVVATEMKKLVSSRLYLLQARNSRLSYAAQRKDIPHNVQVTKLELGLMEAVDALYKVLMDRQLLHIALQKCIQSTMLFISPKNLFSGGRLNYIERCASDQMKLMLSNSEAMCTRKQINDQQVRDILVSEEQLMGRVSYQQEKVKQTTDTHPADDEFTTLKALKKKIDDINRMSTFITVLMSNHCHSMSDEHARRFIAETVKWRTPRTFAYYKNLCCNRSM